MKRKIYKLAIESGIGGGSVSIVENGKILDYRSGKNSANKADSLIEEITDLLNKHRIEKSKITEVIYSDYPGSHMGLKIGASVAKGLHLALNTAVKNKNLFDGIHTSYLGNEECKMLIVLPSGGGDFVWRIYDETGSVVDEGRSSSEKNEIKKTMLDKSAGLKILFPLQLFDDTGWIYQKFDLDNFEGQIETVDLGENLSGYLESE